MSELSKKATYAWLTTSAALVASSVPGASVGMLAIPGTPVSVPLSFLWFAWLFLLVPFALELKAANLRIAERLSEHFHRQLERYFRRRRPQEPVTVFENDPIRPEGCRISSESTKSDWSGLRWERTYSVYYVVGDIPVATARVGPARSLLYAAFATLTTFFQLQTLERLTVPVLAACTALAMATWSFVRGT